MITILLKSAAWDKPHGGMLRLYLLFEQANTKRQNRECEFALRDAELMLALAAVGGELNEGKLHA